MTCACGRPASANDRECPDCFRSRIGSVGNHFTPTSSSKAGRGQAANRKFMANLGRYRQLRAEGVQPKSTERADVEQAMRLSDTHGEAFRADQALIDRGEFRR